MRTVTGPNQLRGNPNFIANFLHAAFEDIGDAQFAGDFPYILVAVLVLERRRPRYDAKFGVLRQHVQ